MNKETYTYVLRRLKIAYRRKRYQKWGTNSWFLFHDNAPAHRSVLVIKDFLANSNATTLEHLPYSPACLRLNFTCSLDWNKHWRGGAFVMLLLSLWMQRKSWKAFTKMSSRNVSITCTATVRSVQLQEGLSWRKCGLNDLLFCISRK